MTAGDLPYRLDFVYASDDAIPIAAADDTFLPGLPVGKVDWSSPGKTVQGDTYWLATSANPNGVVTGKVPFAGPFGFTVALVDAVPLYLALGTAADAAGDDDFSITGSASGAVPNLIFHREHNKLGANFAAEYSRCYCRACDVKTNDGFLHASLEFLTETETTTLVVRQTNAAKLRGKSLAIATGATGRGKYSIAGNADLTCTWNSKAIGAYLSEVAFNIQNALLTEPVEDGSDTNVIFNRGRRTFGDVVLEFVLPDGTASDLDDLDALVDGSTSSSLVLKIPRRHANDYLQFTFAGAELKSFVVHPSPASNVKAAFATAVFHGVTQLTVLERQVTAAAASDTNAAADYEL